MLHELRDLIGFDAGCFIHPGAAGEMEVFMENPVLQAALPNYFEPRILASEAQVMRRGSCLFQEALQRERGVQMLPQTIKVPLPELLRSEFFNEVLRPGDVGDSIKLLLHAPGGEGVGVLWLFRREDECRFTPDEAAELMRLGPVLARALRPGVAAEDVEVEGEGLLIVSPDGHLQWMSPEAPVLLSQALGTRWRARSVHALPDAVQLLVQRLFWPGADVDAPLPDATVRNAQVPSPCAPRGLQARLAAPKRLPFISRATSHAAPDSWRDCAPWGCRRGRPNWLTGSSEGCRSQ